jgi:hypothetical protein
MMTHAACTAAAASPLTSAQVIRTQRNQRRGERLVARVATGSAGDAEAADDVETQREAVAAEGEVAVEAEVQAAETTAMAAETVVKPKKKKKKKVGGRTPCRHI